jgi:hypothetical protein
MGAGMKPFAFSLDYIDSLTVRSLSESFQRNPMTFVKRLRMPHRRGNRHIASWIFSIAIKMMLCSGQGSLNLHLPDILARCAVACRHLQRPVMLHRVCTILRHSLPHNHLKLSSLLHTTNSRLSHRHSIRPKTSRNPAINPARIYRKNVLWYREFRVREGWISMTHISNLISSYVAVLKSVRNQKRILILFFCRLVLLVCPSQKASNRVYLHDVSVMQLR